MLEQLIRWFHSQDEQLRVDYHLEAIRRGVTIESLVIKAMKDKAQEEDLNAFFLHEVVPNEAQKHSSKPVID